MKCIDNYEYASIMISHAITMVFFIIIFANYFTKKNQYEYAWFCSKIYTIKKMVKENAYKTQLFNYFTEDGQANGLEANYYDLLKISEPSGCLGKYKQCGILDTLEHKLCIDKDFPCPVNEIVMDYASNLDYYLSLGYSIRQVDYLTYNYKFYYTNSSIHRIAIVILKKTMFPPKYFDYENIYFENEFIYNFFGVNNSDSDFNLIVEKEKIRRRMEDSDDKSTIEIVGDLFSFLKDIIDIIKEYSDNGNFEQFLEYVVEKLEKENNIDIYYKPIGDKCYIKNYIGFDTFKDIERFFAINFDIYKKTFPNKLTLIFALIGFILFLLILIIISILFYKGIQECIPLPFTIFTIIHLVFFIGFMVSFSRIYKAYHNKELKSKIRAIKADVFITKFLNEFEKKLKNDHFVDCVIAFFTISIFIQLLSFILSLLWKIISIKYGFGKDRSREKESEKPDYTSEKTTSSRIYKRNTRNSRRKYYKK
jgi:hypothetical protein